ncbi:helix-turn-helix transcriptional regulator [Sphingomonas sp. MMS12-HWE2-04]|uniref:helix-turn-helix domain-containing protein n=1 Tax=Sphingomonas sp. MMS12-HWE2-04 TaxID=3234199 RepID=UPI00384A5330
MSLPDHPPESFASLSERELEVLRLLASGHTVKTIAAQLGRSEASINERLRDARRKTGAASSRELARLLNAQKIWDKNIDLSTQRCAADTPPQPTTSGLKRSKGTRIVLIAVPITAVGLIVATMSSMQQPAAPQAAQAAASSQVPLVGNWLLDVSRMPKEERPQRVTISFRVSQDRKWTTRVEIVAPDGTRKHAESTAAVDGAPVPISGNLDFTDTVALRQPAANTLVMTLGKKGAPVSTRIYTVAKDRKSMTETIIWPGEKLPGLETTYFNRID